MVFNSGNIDRSRFSALVSEFDCRLSLASLDFCAASGNQDAVLAEIYSVSSIYRCDVLFHVFQTVEIHDIPFWRQDAEVRNDSVFFVLAGIGDQREFIFCSAGFSFYMQCFLGLSGNVSAGVGSIAAEFETDSGNGSGYAGNRNGNVPFPFSETSDLFFAPAVFLRLCSRIL